MGLRRRKAYLYRMVAAAGAVLAALCGSGCEDLQTPPGQAPPAIQLRQVTLRHYGEDALLGIGHGQVVSYLRDSGQLDGRTLVMDLPPSDQVGRGGAQIKAATGSGDIRGQTALLTGGVSAVTAVGDHAVSEAALYQASTDTLSGTTPVQATSAGQEVAGDVWTFHVRERQVQLHGNVAVHSVGMAP